jgi:hypothetical protein
LDEAEETFESVPLVSLGILDLKTPPSSLSLLSTLTPPYKSVSLMYLLSSLLKSYLAIPFLSSVNWLMLKKLLVLSCCPVESKRNSKLLVAD